jgi:hypothetical protein
MKLSHPAFSLLPVAALLTLSCGTSVYREVYPTLLDGKYDSEFPYRACSQELEQIGESVKMINAIAFYRTYTFTEEERVLPSSVTKELLGAPGRHSVMSTSQTSGTATIVTCADRRVVLLTCAHVIGFPDTITSFYIGPDHHSTGIVHTISFKEKQTNYVAVFPEGGELEVLALDREQDVALLGKTFEGDLVPRPRVFMYPAGRARELEWGTFVYLFGYPTGHKMVTKAIVSSPNKDKRGAFLVDAVFTPGFSGGIALAVRDGVPNFELVGMVKLVSGRSTYVLVPPSDDTTPDYDPMNPYRGDIFVQKRTEIEYGIVQAIPVESILEFIEAHRGDLAARGYNVSLPEKPSASR